MMKRIIPIISVWVGMLVLVGQPAMGDDLKNHEFLYRYLVGDYLVVGKQLNSDKTYYGEVIFSLEKDHLLVTRDIQGEIVKGVGKIEHTLGTDEADVLRVRFTRTGHEFEITYIWRSDLDNYARMSGYLYQPGKKTDSPGLEVLFIDHSKK